MNNNFVQLELFPPSEKYTSATTEHGQFFERCIENKQSLDELVKSLARLDTVANDDPMDIMRKMEDDIPLTTEKFRDIIADLYELFCAKMYNYGSGNIMLGGKSDVKEDVDLAIQGVVIRMHDKINRLVQLTLKNKEDVVNESVSDTFTDIANYAVIALILMDKGVWGK